jgi:DNA-binding MarR family transcriptional regulator
MKLKPEETIDFHLRWGWFHISRIYGGEASKIGGSVSQGLLLLNIDKEGTRSTRLGPKMGMEPRSLPRTLKLLETEGLIERVPDTADKRVVWIKLTDKGRKKREAARKTVIALNEYIKNKIPDDKMQIFFEVISEVNAVLSNDGEKIIATIPKD